MLDTVESIVDIRASIFSDQADNEKHDIPSRQNRGLDGVVAVGILIRIMDYIMQSNNLT